MPIDLDLNACIANVAAIVKATWNVTTAIHETGMKAQITANKFPFAAIDFEPVQLTRGGQGVTDVRWDMPIRVTWCMATTAGTKDMDQARAKCSALVKALLADDQLANGGAVTCSRIAEIAINFSGSDRFLALCLAREWPAVGASVEFTAIGIEKP